MMLALLASIVNIGMMVIIISLFTCIIFDNLFYLNSLYMTRRWTLDNLKSTLSIILIAAVVVAYNFYTVVPADPLSGQMIHILIAQVLHITIGAVFYNTTHWVAVSGDRSINVSFIAKTSIFTKHQH